jgi:hypothetical protein
MRQAKHFRPDAVARRSISIRAAAVSPVNMPSFRVWYPAVAVADAVTCTISHFIVSALLCWCFVHTLT